MEAGNAELTRASTHYCVCLAFALTFQVASICGASALTATLRGVVIAVIVRVIGPQFLRPVWSVILEAMARDQSAQTPAEEDSP